MTVKTISKSDQGVETAVPSRIEVEINGVISNYVTDSAGAVPIEIARCDASVRFRASPLLWLYTPDDDWKPCSSDPLVLYMTRIRHAAIYETALESDLTVFDSRLPGIAALGKTLAASIAKGDTAAASADANNIAALLRSIGENKLAASFGATAMYGGYLSLGTPPEQIASGDLLMEDPGQGVVVMSNSGQEQLRAFQRGAGVPVSGQWDYRTFEALVTDGRT